MVFQQKEQDQLDLIEIDSGFLQVFFLQILDG
jgi:hypothetical protein